MLEQFESDAVIVTLEWHHQDISHNSYYVNITPDIAMRINGSASINLKLKVPYNTLYNVSIAATPPCGQTNVTSFTELLYRESMIITVSVNYNEGIWTCT